MNEKWFFEEMEKKNELRENVILLAIYFEWLIMWFKWLFFTVHLLIFALFSPHLSNFCNCSIDIEEVKTIQVDNSQAVGHSLLYRVSTVLPKLGTYINKIWRHIQNYYCVRSKDFKVVKGAFRLTKCNTNTVVR